MKKTILLVLFVCLFNKNFAQEITKLNSKFYIDFDELYTNNGIIEIKELINYDFYSDFDDETLKKINIEKAKKTKSEFTIFKPQKGKYVLEDEFFKMRFDVNDKGEFINNTIITFENGENEIQISFPFVNGKFSKATASDSKGNVFYTVEISDSSTKFNHFDADGKLEQSTIIKKGDKIENALQIRYYPNGQMMSEIDRSKNIEKSYFENGILEFSIDGNTQERFYYYDNGQLKSHDYLLSQDEKCTNDFKDNQLILTRCINYETRISTTKFYKNSSLDYYFIEDESKLERRKYDQNDQLIETIAIEKKVGIAM